MANRLWHRIDTAERNRKLIAGSWAPAGAGAITSPKGEGFSVERTGVGLFTITFQDRFVDLECAEACFQVVTGPWDSYLQLGAYDATAKTLIVRSIVAGAAADVAADPELRFNFQATVKI